MKNNKSDFNQLLKNTKFSTYNPLTKDIILAEYIIATSILNGYSFNNLLEETNQIAKEKERSNRKTEISNLILDFINLNPEYAEVLRQND